MGSTWVDGSPDWGSIGTNMMSAFAGAPAKAAQQTHLIETIKDQRIKRARDEEQYQLGKALAGSIEAQTPAAYVAPRAYTAADISNPAVLDAPLSVTDRVSGSYGGADVANGMFTDPRALALAEARRKTAILGEKATLMKDPEKWASQSAYAENAAAGMPADFRERARLQFGTLGKYPTAEEMKTPNAQNFSIVKADGTGTGFGYASLDGGKTAIDGTPIKLGAGERIMETGPAPLAASNPMKDKSAAIERLTTLSKTIGADGATPDQVAQLQQLISVAYPPERVIEQDPNNKDLQVVKYIQKEPIPPWVIAMLQPPAPPPAPAAAAAAPTTIASQAITARDISTPAKLDAPLAPPPAAAAPTPIVAPAAVDPNADRVVQPLAGSAESIRKEYAQQPEIKTYQTAANTWNALVQSAYTGNKAEDLNIVYSFVKLLDSLTGVRDAEVKMVGQVGSWQEQLNTMIGQATGGGLDSETRANILATVQKHIGEVEAAARDKERFFSQVATDSRLAPKAVLPELPPLIKYDPGRARAVGTDAAVPPMPPNPATATSPEDVKARQWATKPENANTPEAKAIIQHLNTR
jgi:hypothetical protein